MAYITALTSLRGIAAWWVVLYHFREALMLPYGHWLLSILNFGYVSVDFFFILSGFVLYLNYHSLFLRFSISAFKEFCIKRCARVYPLHIVMLLLYLSVPLAFWGMGKPVDTTARFSYDYFFASVFLVQNWGFFGKIAWNIPAWSISTEFAAYLLFPFLVPLLRQYLRGWLSVAVLMCALWGGLAVVYRLGGLPSLGSGIESYGVIRCVFEFCMGMLLGILYLQQTLVGKFAAIFSALFVGAIVGVGVFCHLPDYAFVPAFFTGLICFICVCPRWIAALFENGLLVYLGKVSYATYLCHYFVKDWVKLLSPSIGLTQFFIYLLLILAASHVLYKYVELPGQQWGREFFRKKNNAG